MQSLLVTASPSLHADIVIYPHLHQYLHSHQIVSPIITPHLSNRSPNALLLFPTSLFLHPTLLLQPPLFSAQSPTTSAHNRLSIGRAHGDIEWDTTQRLPSKPQLPECDGCQGLHPQLGGVEALAQLLQLVVCQVEVLVHACADTPENVAAQVVKHLRRARQGGLGVYRKGRGRGVEEGRNASAEKGRGGGEEMGML